jgi:hypothetical protein
MKLNILLLWMSIASALPTSPRDVGARVSSRDVPPSVVDGPTSGNMPMYF